MSPIKISVPIKQKLKKILAIVLFVLVLASWILFLTGRTGLSKIFAYAGFALGIIPVLTITIRDLLSKSLNIDTLVSMAAIGAVIVGYPMESATVLFIHLLGDFMEDYTVEKARRELEKLLSLLPDRVSLRKGTDIVEVKLSDVREGDIVIVRSGEWISVDGVIVYGSAVVNQAQITGESVPVDKTLDDTVISGTIVETGTIEIKATNVGEASTIVKIKKMTEEALEKKAPTARLVDRYAIWIIPITLIFVGIVYLITSDIIRAITLLIIVCPCAFVIGTPSAVIAAITSAAKQGILIRGGEALESVGILDTFIFDKTGTLTRGKLKLIAIKRFCSHSEQELLSFAATAESLSEHPLGQAIVLYAKEKGVPVKKPDTVEIRKGMGVVITSGGARVIVGNRRIMKDCCVPVPPNVEDYVDSREKMGETALVIAHDDKICGIITLADIVRETSRQAIAALKQLGISRFILSTGDNQYVASAVAKEVGIDEVIANQMPEDKVAKIRQIISENHRVAMVGDGINDGPALATANVGIAMGVSATDITLVASDVALMSDNLTRISDVVVIGRKTRRIIHQNLWIAFISSFGMIIAATMGALNMLTGVLLHEVATVIVTLNSSRLLNYRRLTRLLIEKFKQLKRKFWELTGWNIMPEWGKYAQFIKTNRKIIIKWCVIAVAVLYVFSGFYIINIDEQGIKLRFNKVVKPVVSQGLQYCLPYPFEKIIKVNTKGVRRMEIGFRSKAGVRDITPEIAERVRLWESLHIYGMYEKKLEEAILVTGDENLLDVNLVVQWRVRTPYDFVFNTNKPVEIIHRLSESVTRETIAGIPLDDILTIERSRLQGFIKGKIQGFLDAYEVGVEVLNVLLEDIHPPVEVVPAFRDVFSAREDMDRLINESRGYFNEAIPWSEGRFAEMVNEAHGYGVERIQKAVGESDRFEKVVRSYWLGRGATRARLYLETIEKALPEMDKIVVDTPQMLKGQYDLWFMDSPGKASDFIRKK